MTPEDYDAAVAVIEKRARVAARTLGGMPYSEVRDLEFKLKAMGEEMKELKRAKAKLLRGTSDV